MFTVKGTLITKRHGLPSTLLVPIPALNSLFAV